MAKVVRALRWPVFALLWLGWVLGELARYVLLGPREAPPVESEYITIAVVEEAQAA
jgi:hypothetical protein